MTESYHTDYAITLRTFGELAGLKDVSCFADAVLRPR